MSHIGEMQVDSPLLSSVLLYRAVYHDLAHQFIEDSGVKLLIVQVLVYQLQKLVHIGKLPGLRFDFPFQSSGKLLNLPPAPSHIAEIILSTGCRTARPAHCPHKCAGYAGPNPPFASSPRGVLYAFPPVLPCGFPRPAPAFPA